MARKTNKVNTVDVNHLRKEVIKQTAFNIDNPVDCVRLSDAVFRKTKHYISAATLKRFMGFYASGFKPSYQTLDILSIYCGYDGWTDYNNPSKTKTTVTNEELALFTSFFNIKDYTQISDHDETMQLLSRRIAERLREDPKAFEKIVPELAKNKLAQTFYFEHFPDYDNLVSYQYKGYIEYLKHKTTPEALLFGNCMLFFRAFLLMDVSLMKHYYEILLKLNVPDNIHPMPLGRYYQCLMLYTHIIERKPLTKILKQIYALEKQMPRIGLHFKNFPGFHYFVADALVLCGYYKDVLKIITLATNNYRIYREFVWKGYYRQFQLMQAEAYYHLNEKEKALALLHKIHPKQFYFISRGYFTIRCNLLKSQLGIGTKEIKTQTQALLKKCEFLCFN